MAEWTCDRSFVVLAALGGLHGRESVACIENGIAEQKVQRTVKIGRAAIGDDLKTCPAGTGEARRIRILIDPYLLHRGRRHSWPVGLNAVNNERYAVCTRRVVVEKTRHGGDVILVKHWDAVERIAVYRVRILILRGLRADQGDGNSCRNRHILSGNGDLKSDPQRSLPLRGERDLDPHISESLGMQVEPIAARRHAIEAEPTGMVGDSLRQ